MSAIAGILCLDRGATEVEAAERMAAARRWRGPDDDGSYRSPHGYVALAAHRLAMVDGSIAAGLPMANETHDVWLVLDGEILNYRTLRHSLELVGHHFRSGSDAEVVLHAYEQWELGFLPHLQGAFALALWDDRRDRLVLARDRLGRKPLFVAEHRGRLGFASGLGPLLDEMALPRRLSPTALAQYLTFGVVPAPATLVAGISKLAPGEMLVSDRVGPPRRQFWHNGQPEPNRAAWVRRLAPDAHAGNLRTLLECAVADRLLGDAPVGVWLTPSAGSGAIAAIVNRLTGCPPYGVAVMDDPLSAAALEMRAMAKAAGLHPAEIIVGAEQLARALPVLCDRLAEPVAHAGLAAAWFAAQTAGEAGIMALLNDSGSDELLLCHPAYDGARRAGLAHRLSGLLPRRLRSALSVLHPVATGLAMPPPGLRPCGDSDGAALLALPPAQGYAAAAPAWMQGDVLAALGWNDMRLRLSEGVAAGLDAMAQAHGLESRLPFLDEALLDYAMAVPSRLRSPATAPRQMMRRVLGNLVPPAAMARSRPAACLPLNPWLAGPLAPLLDNLPKIWPLLHAPAFEALRSRHRETQTEGEALWALLVLGQWCRNLGLEELAEARPPQAELAHSRS